MSHLSTYPIFVSKALSEYSVLRLPQKKKEDISQGLSAS